MKTGKRNAGKSVDIASAQDWRLAGTLPRKRGVLALDFPLEFPLRGAGSQRLKINGSLLIDENITCSANLIGPPGQSRECPVSTRLARLEVRFEEIVPRPIGQRCRGLVEHAGAGATSQR